MNSRRTFLYKSAVAGSGLILSPHFAFAGSSGQEVLRVGLIGIGLRGTNHLKNLLLREDVSIAAICDIDPLRVDLNLELIQKASQKKPRVFGKNDHDYRNLLELKDLDAVIISTPWEWHVKMAVDAMKAGKYAGLEVSAATTMEGCWDLFKTH